VLVLPSDVAVAVVAHCLRDVPLEACGLLVGAGAEPADGQARVVRAVPTANSARSARVYTVEPRDLLRADREAEADGLSLIGVYHSHTHTEAYPSPTDVASAPDPAWHYLLVSLRDLEPSLRSYRIEDGKIREEPVVLQ
jgi:proteasome lid subunit RPN8/RPN11